MFQETLTPREHEVLESLARGLSNREIAERLGVSEHTAKFHVASILAKLGAANRADAVGRALRKRAGQSVTDRADGCGVRRNRWRTAGRLLARRSCTRSRSSVRRRGSRRGEPAAGRGFAPTAPGRGRPGARRRLGIRLRSRRSRAHKQPCRPARRAHRRDHSPTAASAKPIWSVTIPRQTWRY